MHAERALELDSGSAWAWGRSAWVKAYRGYARQAIEDNSVGRFKPLPSTPTIMKFQSLDPLLRLMCSAFTGRSALQQPNFRAHVTGSQLTGTTARLPKIPQARGSNVSSRPPMSLRGVWTRVTIPLPSSRQLSRI